MKIYYSVRFNLLFLVKKINKRKYRLCTYGKYRLRISEYIPDYWEKNDDYVFIGEL